MPFSTLIDLSARTEQWARAEGRGWSHSEMLPVFGAVLISPPPPTPWETGTLSHQLCMPSLSHGLFASCLGRQLRPS